MVMPLSLEEFRIGQRYCTVEATKKTARDGEGVETLENKPYTDPETGATGQYTHKIYKLYSKIPYVMQKLFSPESATFHEESYNSFPYTKTTITNPAYMKGGFEAKVETWHKPMCFGEKENVHGLPADVWNEVQVTPVQLSPVNRVDYSEGTDPFKKKCSKAPNRFPLDSDWIEQYKSSSASQLYMCIYKLITIRFEWMGLQYMTERFMHSQQERLLRLFSRTMIGEFDDWCELTMEDVEKLETDEFTRINEAMEKAAHEPLVKNGSGIYKSSSLGKSKSQDEDPSFL